jgi:hypothetical protein
MLDFQRIKEIKLTDVLARYKIPLRFRSDYAVCACPLPIHKPNDTSKSFSVNLRQNYWRCFSESCNENNSGKRGGDVINFVALMEGCRERDAAQKLADWFGVRETKTPTHIEQGRRTTQPQQNAIENPSNSSDSVKYMASIDLWLEASIGPHEGEPEDEYWKRLRKSFKSKLVESYRAGQKSK